MNIRTSTWHYRWYRYWSEYGRGNRGRQENLCHYVRVLLFWAPMTWIDQHTFWNWEKLGQKVFIGIMVLYLGSIVTFGIVLLMIYWWIHVLMALGSLIALIAILVGLWYIIAFLTTRKYSVPDTVKLTAAYVVAQKRHVCPLITFEEE